MKRYPSPKLVARMHFFYPKNSVKIEQKYINTRNCQYLVNGWKYLKILKFSVYWATFRSTKNAYWSKIKSKKNIFRSKLNFIFKLVKLSIGSKFRGWVSFPTAILQSWKSQEYLKRTVTLLVCAAFCVRHGKNGFVTATKLGTTNNFFVAATKNFATATKRFVYRTKHFVVVTKYFVIPILTNDFVGITKPFFPWGGNLRPRSGRLCDLCFALLGFLTKI